MQWKRNARKLPVFVQARALENQTREMVERGNQWSRRIIGETKRVRDYHGKPQIAVTHTRDLCDDGQVIASETFKEGDIIAPVAYTHKTRKLYGETRDLIHTPKGWRIYLEAVLRDPETGEIVLDWDGYQIDLSGWFYESELSPVEDLGQAPITPGKFDPEAAYMFDPEKGDDGITRRGNDGADRGRGHLKDHFGARNHAMGALEPWRMR